MQDHSVKSDTVLNDIPDMSATPLRKLVLSIAATRLADAEQSQILQAEIQDRCPTDTPATQTLSQIFSAPKNEKAYIEGLQYMGAAFAQAYKLDTPPPDPLTQSQWNRTLRDQGERLRAASLTLGAGRVAIAGEQLSAVSQFFEKYFHNLPQ